MTVVVEIRIDLRDEAIRKFIADDSLEEVLTETKGYDAPEVWMRREFDFPPMPLKETSFIFCLKDEGSVAPFDVVGLKWREDTGKLHAWMEQDPHHDKVLPSDLEQSLWTLIERPYYWF